ncbi:hypothetical protein ACFVXG_23215 [Kitasatospora sp. NPDC058162]|uniref:hypothetical protein n=1 Tax=Kitasatospora sp. NPDC058162 TaxID=3346362 RepID=UPI0036DE4438
MPENDHPQPTDLLVDVTPAAPLPRSRRKFWLGAAVVGVLAVAAFGVVFADNFANLGAYKYSPPTHFDGLQIAPKASRSKVVRLNSDSGVSATTYLGGEDGRTIFLTVSEQHIFTPSSELDDLVARQRSNGVTFTDLHDVDPGERGGVMKCGTTDYEGHPVAVCDWADGSMWGVYDEMAEDGAIDPGGLAARARDFRKLAEVPS